MPVIPYGDRENSKNAEYLAKRCCCKTWKPYWIIHQIIAPINIIITLYYWTLIKPEPNNKTPFLTDYFSHLHPVLAIILDYSLVHAPYKPRHFTFLLIFCVIYAFAINMPMALGGTPAYKLITWDSWGSGALIAGLFFLVIILHTVFVCLSYCCKAKCFKR